MKCDYDNTEMPWNSVEKGKNVYICPKCGTKYLL